MYDPQTDETGIARLLLEREGPGTYELDLSDDESGTRLTWVPAGGTESRSVSVPEVFTIEQQAMVNVLRLQLDVRTDTRIHVEWDLSADER